MLLPSLFSRRILVSAVAAAAMVGATGVVRAADPWPNQPFKIVVGFAPGGGNDLLARILARELQQTLGQPFVVENRAGAGGLIADDFVAKAKPDGYTLLLGSVGGNTVAPILARKTTFDPRKDLAPITLIAESGNALLVNAKLPYQSVKDVIAAAKKAPGTLNYGSSGTGSSLHLAGALFAKEARVDMVHIPYKGNSQALTDVAAGQIQSVFSGIPPAIQSQRTGATRILAVTTRQRVKSLPDVPTIAESGVPGYEFSSWYGLFTTGGTPPAVIERLAKEVQTILAKPEVAAQFAAQGVEPATNSPKVFTAFIDHELTRWTKEIKAMNITLD